MKILPLAAFALLQLAVSAQLAVTVSPPQITGQKAVIKLGLKNEFSEKIESARATVFLLDDQGKMPGQATRWVIGGEKGKPGLSSGATNLFHFVVTTDKRFASTNISAKVTFNRLVLDGGKPVDVSKQVRIAGYGK